MRSSGKIDSNFCGVFGGCSVTPGRHAQALDVNKFKSASMQRTILLFEKDCLTLDCIGLNVKKDMINIHVKLHKSHERPVVFLPGNPHYPTCFRLDLHLNKGKSTKHGKRYVITYPADLVVYIEVELQRWYNEWVKHKEMLVSIFKNRFSGYNCRWSRRCELSSPRSRGACVRAVDECHNAFCSVDSQWDNLLKMKDGVYKRQYLTTIISELQKLVLSALPVDHTIMSTAPQDAKDFYDNAIQLRQEFLDACDAVMTATTPHNELIKHCLYVAIGYKKLVSMGSELAKVLKPVVP